MLVKATKTGYYGGSRRKVGDVFAVKPELMSKTWMEPYTEPKPEAVPVSPAKEDKNKSKNKEVI